MAGDSESVDPRRIWFVGLLVAAAAALHWPTLGELQGYWSDTATTTYTHGYLIAAISVWMLWHKRDSLARARFAPAVAAVVPLLLAELSWLFALEAGIQLVTLLLLPLILWLAVLAVFGPRTARLTGFSFAYLLFAIPLWNSVNPLAQWSTVYAVRLLLRIVGIDAFFDQNYVHIQSGTFEIAGGCSGLHFIMVALAMAALMGELRQDGVKNRIKLGALALLLAVLTNWVRVLVIIIAGDLSHMQHYLVRVSHYGFGWCVFAGAMFIFFLCERRMNFDPVSAAAQDSHADHRPRRGRLTVVAALLATALPAAAIAMINHREEAPPSRDPPALPGWSGTPEPPTGWMPVFEGARSESSYGYRSQAASLIVYTAWYAQQRQGSEFTGFHNTVWGELKPEDSPRRIVTGERQFNVAGVKSRDNARQTLWYGYAVGNRWFADPMKAQIWSSVLTLSRLRPPASRVLAVSMACASDCAEADQLIGNFVGQWP